jgi:hypothetical protein
MRRPSRSSIRNPSERHASQHGDMVPIPAREPRIFKTEARSAQFRIRPCSASDACDPN